MQKYELHPCSIVSVSQVIAANTATAQFIVCGIMAINFAIINTVRLAEAYVADS